MERSWWEMTRSWTSKNESSNRSSSIRVVSGPKLDKWSATTFSSPALCRISKSNSWRRTHWMRWGSESNFFNRCSNVAWSVKTMTLELIKYDQNFSNTNIATKIHSPWWHNSLEPHQEFGSHSKWHMVCCPSFSLKWLLMQNHWHRTSPQKEAPNSGLASPTETNASLNMRKALKHSSLKSKGTTLTSNRVRGFAILKNP